MNWTITPTEQFGDIAQVNGTCSDGTVIATPLIGMDTEGKCGGGRLDVKPSKVVMQPDNEGVFSYE